MNTLKTTVKVATLMACLASVGCDTFTSNETRLARAEKQMAALDYRSALIELKNVLQDEPDNARAHLDLAQVVLRLGNPSHAAIELKRALELAAGKPFPKGEGIPDPVELDVRIRFAMNKGEEVLADIDSGKITLPPAQRALYRGQSLLIGGRIPEAQSELEAAVKADPESSRASIGLAQVYAIQGNAKQAFETLDAFLAKKPSSAETWLAKSILLAAARRGAEAEKALEKANENASQLTMEQQARVLATLTRTKLQRGDIDAAQKLHENLVDISAEAPITRILSAQIALARKDYDGASSQLQRLVQSVPDFVPARILLGDVLIKQNRLEQADLHLSQAVQKAPKNVLARQLLSSVRKQLGRPDYVDAPEEVAAQGKSPKEDPRLAKITEYLRTGQKDKAVGEYEKLVSAHPKSPGLLNNLAWLYFEVGDKRALETARKAHERAPKVPEISDTYGWILFKSGQEKEGLALLKSAADISKNPEIQKHYDEALAASGK